MLDSITKVVRGIVRLRGASDGTLIGNSGNKLLVEAGSSGQKDLALAGKVYAFSATVNAASSGTDNPLILLRNPSGSGKNIFIIDCFCGVDVTNNFFKFKMFSRPTITSVGTLQTTRNRYITTPVQPTSAALLYTLPTLSSNGNQHTAFINGQNSNSVSIITAFQMVISPGHDICVTGDPSSNNRGAVIAFVWSEESI